MKGLLKNNFYGITDSLKVVALLLIILGAVLALLGDASMVGIFPFMPAPLLAVLSLSCLRRESASRWCRYKLTLPVRRSDIVKSQYISHALCSASGAVAAAIFLAVTVAIHGNIYFYYGFRDALTLIMGGLILSLLMGAAAYPLCYIWGAERMEIILIIALTAAIAVVFGLSLLLNVMLGDAIVSDILYYISLLAITVVTAAVYIGSCFAAAAIYERKEY